MNSTPVAVNAPAKNVLLRMPTPSTLSGRVMEKTSGQAVTDFQVVTMTGDAGNNRPSPPSQIHSEDGTFSVPVIPGRTELRVTAAGFVRATLSGLTVEEGKPLSGIEVRMDRGGRVVGRVTSAGEPVSQAYVTAFADRYTGAQPGATTDANGEYVIDGVDAGQRTVEARKTGLLPKNRQVVAKAGEDVRADLELDKGREVHGRVLDRSGHPIESVRILLTGVEDRSMHANATTDVEGNFNVSGLGEGHLTLRAERDGYVAGALDDVDPAQNILITLDRGGSISGRVIGLSDAETGLVSVTASYGGASARATVDTDGNFTVNGVPDGSVSLSAMKAGTQMRHSAPKAVTVANGSAPFVEIDFAEGISVRGRVTREGAPVAGGGINFMGLNGAQSGNSQLAPDGTYQVNGLQAGDYRVLVSLYGTAGVSSSEKLTVTGSMTHDIDLTGTSLRGRVLNAQTHAPLSDVTVQLRAVAAAMPTVRQVLTDSDGRFLVELLKEGSYRLNATRSQYAARQQDISVPGPEVEISLDPATPTIVYVVDSVSGAGLTADVMATLDASKVTMGSGRAMSDGTIQLWLPDGHYSLHASAPGYTPVTVDLVVPSSDVRIPLQRGGTITFRLHGSETNYRVRLMVSGVPQHTDYINVAYRTSLPGITPGTYVAEVTSVDGKTPHGTYPVTVLAGQTTFVDVVN
jgi:5-hydroxyisourate hydrolase-like protein (transthyretin family)